ncbi:MAG TPA: hypothetical protein VGV15_07870 [Terriglobales bacterium]|nr:hypothetical protein [Terriglobales bacterium]
MSNSKILLLLFAVATALAQATAQASNEAEKKDELGLVIGATVVPSQTPASGIPANPASLTFTPSLALGAEFDRGLTASQHLGILAGLDFLASPLDVKLDQRPVNAIPEYAYIFLTPHIRVKFRPKGAISPWLLLGGGYARYAESAPPGGLRSATNTGALEFGGGIDTTPVRRVWRIPIGFRLEVRDFYTGQPNYNLPVSGNLQHNIVFTGGLLVGF